LRTCHVETVYVLWNYVLSLRTCHVETVYVLWRNYVLNDFKVFDETSNLLVLREHDLVIAWFLAWHSSEIYTGQAQNIEHVV
jgi:hypothetical protein